jgi:hypothetical protein
MEQQRVSQHELVKQHSAAQNAAIIYSLFATCKHSRRECIRLAEICYYGYAHVPFKPHQGTATAELEVADH